jgi:hypothetical protein
VRRCRTARTRGIPLEPADHPMAAFAVASARKLCSLLRLSAAILASRRASSASKVCLRLWGGCCAKLSSQIAARMTRIPPKQLVRLKARVHSLKRTADIAGHRRIRRGVNAGASKNAIDFGQPVRLNGIIHQSPICRRTACQMVQGQESCDGSEPVGPTYGGPVTAASVSPIGRGVGAGRSADRDHLLPAASMRTARIVATAGVKSDIWSGSANITS